MKENIIITSIVFTTVGAIILITNSVPKYNYYLLNNIEYKEIMNKLDDFDKRLKKIEKIDK
jgi:hypothetical protein